MPPSSPEDRPRVLIVDDEQLIRDVLADFLGLEGYLVRTAPDGLAAVEELRRRRYDLVISDMKMPRMGGLELLAEIAKLDPTTVTIIMTGFGTVESAIDAMKRGAYDYVLKPFRVEEVIRIVQRGLDKQRLESENLRLKEAVSLYQVSEAISASLSLDEVLATIADSTHCELVADLLSTWLDDGEGAFFERQYLGRPGFPLVGSMGKLDSALFASHLSAERSLLEHGERAAAYFAEAPAFEPVSLVAVPLKAKQRLIGWISAVSFTPHVRFDEGQRKMLSIIASRAAAAIENARLYEDLQASFQQTIEGLAAAIDKMDRYTSGHSTRVAAYATYLARRLGMSPSDVEIVRQSALMHDIGKLGCVMNLNKPGKLTQQEYEVFKLHPGFGRDILEPIKFLHPLIPGVHLHHEMWGGKGYPLGLAGDEIPIIARVVSVADTYDAMTSDRAYRRALPHDVAVAEIERCAGTQFDPEVAASFTEGLDEYREALVASGDAVPE
ncbi:MAG: response regulator [Polyangiaceae bacterium]|nr:response regulator [Polyangiaceae bacterium]